MVKVDRIRLGTYEFEIFTASFRYITTSWSGPGWDFNFSGRIINRNPDDLMILYDGAALFTEAAPIPLAKASNYTGVELRLPLEYDEESGEPFFGFQVVETHPVSEVNLKFCERDGDRYRIEITAIVDKSCLGNPEQLELNAWAVELPDHAYPV